MCCLLVSGFLTEITQQIHSLRASGVMSSHFASAAGSEVRTFRKSAGRLCTAPVEIAFLVVDFILAILLRRCCSLSRCRCDVSCILHVRVEPIVHFPEHVQHGFATLVAVRFERKQHETHCGAVAF
jgi:hypothetical protein